jgi:hypothetical protein
LTWPKIQVLGFDWVTRINSDFFKKSKQHHFSKKKKKLMGYNRVFDQVLPSQLGRRVTPGFDFLYFFLNLARFQLQINPSGRAGFQNYAFNAHFQTSNKHNHLNWCLH